MTSAPDLTTVREAAEYLAARGRRDLEPHQLAAFSGVDGALSPAERQSFSDAWRAEGSPAAPAPAPAPSDNLFLRVPYLSQRDSATTQGDRMCYSSTCAMAAMFLRPGWPNRCTMAGSGQPDDRYLAIVQRFGDTTDVNAQIAALRSLGIVAWFRQDGDLLSIIQKLREGTPVPVGWLHRGRVAAPAGGGHWSLVVGWDERSQQLIIHDPFGEAMLASGGYIIRNSPSRPTAGQAQRYSWKHWGRRWMVEGQGTGWWLELSLG